MASEGSPRRGCLLIAQSLGLSPVGTQGSKGFPANSCRPTGGFPTSAPSLKSSALPIELTAREGVYSGGKRRPRPKPATAGASRGSRSRPRLPLAGELLASGSSRKTGGGAVAPYRAAPGRSCGNCRSVRTKGRRVAQTHARRTPDIGSEPQLGRAGSEPAPTACWTAWGFLSSCLFVGLGGTTHDLLGGCYLRMRTDATAGVRFCTDSRARSCTIPRRFFAICGPTPDRMHSLSGESGACP